MSIDWLLDLERMVEGGKDVFACPGIGKNQWIIGRSVEELKKYAKRVSENRKLQVNIVRLIPKAEAVAGTLFLVPIKIDEPGARGEPQIQWSAVETKEAAEMMRDVRYGPSPFFGMEVQVTISPESTGE